MKTLHFMRIFQVVMLSVFLTGCGGAGCVEMVVPRPHAHESILGQIDLAKRGSRCEGAFRWSSYYPGLVLYLSDTNGPARAVGSSPDWPLTIQLDVYDGSKLTASTTISRAQIVFANWSMPATCLLLRTPDGFGNSFHAGHSYKFVLTVSQEEKSLGLAKVAMHWITGGDSL